MLAFVNGMGGTPLIELYVVYNDLVKYLDGRGCHHHPQPDRSVHHVARDAGLLDHAAQARRRAHRPVGRPGQHAGAPLGGLMADGVTVDMVVAWIATSAERIEEQKAYLTRLDSDIGDADHGINMNRGLQAAMAKLTDSPPTDIGGALNSVGMTMVSKVGGASGPLYGTIFIEMGRRLPARSRSRPGTGRTWSAPGWPGSNAGGRRNRGTRRWSTPFSPPSRPSTVPRRPGHRSTTPWPGRRRRPVRAWRPPPRWWPGRVGPATSASAAPDTRTRARRRPTCCSAPPPTPGPPVTRLVHDLLTSKES